MRKKAFLPVILVLSIILATAAGCNSFWSSKQESGEEVTVQEDGMENREGPRTAKGRYREEKIEFPLSIKNIFDVECKENGNVKILFENEPGSFFFYESADYGISWEPKEVGTEWLPQGYRVVSACFGADGEIAVSAGKMSEDPLDEQHPIGAYSYFKIHNVKDNATVQQLSLQLPEPKEINLESGYGLEQILLSGNGNIYGVSAVREGEDIDYHVFCFGADDGNVLWELDTNTAEIAVFEDKVYLNEYSGKIKILDAESGEKTGDISIPLGHNFLCCMDMDTQKDRIFYCNETGIYGTDCNMALSELLVDGTLSSFSDESYSVKGFFRVSEKVFLVFVQDFSGAEMEVLRYVYDADLPTRPEHELSVYSLKDNSVVEKIISDFQASHPDVFVRYEVGMSEAAAKEEADAISSLNTEIMAGNGPDVLILNGLPWESYREKGILEDLSKDLGAYVTDEKVFENLFLAYRADGFQYVVPISFKIPVLIGKEEAVSEISSAEELLKAAEDTGELPPFFRKNQALMRYIFSIYWQRIEQQEGRISKEELKEALETVKNLNDVLQEKESELSAFFAGDEEREKNYDVFANDTWLDVSNIKYGNAAMDLGYLSHMRDYEDILKWDLSYQTLSDGVFSALIAGINKESKKSDIAGEFLEFALSEEEQKIFEDGMYMVIMGFPVNKAVFEDMALRQEQLEDLEKRILNLDTPAMEDTIIIHTIWDDAAPYLAGEKEIDVTVNEIAQSLELYLLER